MLPHNDVALKLSIRLMTDNNMVDVYSNPEAYPQFNNGRINRDINLYIAAWEEADKSNFNEDEIAAVEKAIADIRALQNETVVDTEKWANAQTALENELVMLNVIEDPNPTCFEELLTKALKGTNQCVNKVYDSVK